MDADSVSALARHFAEEQARLTARRAVVVSLRGYPGKTARDLTRIGIAEHACRMELEKALGGATAVRALAEAADAGGRSSVWNAALARAVAVGLATLPSPGPASFEVGLFTPVVDPQGVLF